MLRKFLAYILPIVFIASPSLPIDASALHLPKPGTMVELSARYEPIILRGLTIDNNKPLHFSFILDQGDRVIASEAKQSFKEQQELKEEAERLIKYFLAALTVPEKELWVNLSPYEKDRTVSEGLGQTDLGRDLLAQDYLLKQLSASLIYPEKELGKAFWDKVYHQAQEMYGHTNIPVITFNKVWIVPDRAQVFENGNTVFVTGSHLKVMHEQDYHAFYNNRETTRGDAKEGSRKRAVYEHLRDTAAAGPVVVSKDIKSSRANHETNKANEQLIREIILPALEKEVNEGKNFAPLRQMYHSIILATWYKANLKEALINKAYSNQNKIKGLEYVSLRSRQGREKQSFKEEPNDIELIYRQYLEAYKKGVFNYIKDESVIARKYFSGGMLMTPKYIEKIGPEEGIKKLKEFEDHAMLSLETQMHTWPDAQLETVFLNDMRVDPSSHEAQFDEALELYQRLAWDILVKRWREDNPKFLILLRNIALSIKDAKVSPQLKAYLMELDLAMVSPKEEHEIMVESLLFIEEVWFNLQQRGEYSIFDSDGRYHLLLDFKEERKFLGRALTDQVLRRMMADLLTITNAPDELRQSISYFDHKMLLRYSQNGYRTDAVDKMQDWLLRVRQLIRQSPVFLLQKPLIPDDISRVGEEMISMPEDRRRLLVQKSEANKITDTFVKKEIENYLKKRGHPVDPTFSQHGVGDFTLSLHSLTPILPNKPTPKMVLTFQEQNELSQLLLNYNYQCYLMPWRNDFVQEYRVIELKDTVKILGYVIQTRHSYYGQYTIQLTSSEASSFRFIYDKFRKTFESTFMPATFDAILNKTSNVLKLKDVERERLIRILDYIKKGYGVSPDPAMTPLLPIDSYGGISFKETMKQLSISKDNSKPTANPSMLYNIQYLSPYVESITPIKSIWSLMGVKVE